MNRGVVIKSNSNQRYASNRVTSLIVRELAKRANLPEPQEFVVRNDCPCGSTIGPIISANTGMRAVDLGMPQVRASPSTCRFSRLWPQPHAAASPVRHTRRRVLLTLRLRLVPPRSSPCIPSVR